MRELHRRATTWFMGTAMTLAAGCGSVDASDPTLQPHVLVDGRWHASGSTLVDSAGREVILRGVNVGDRSKMPPFLPFDYTDGQDLAALADAFFAKLEALSFNAVRLTYAWEALEPTPGTYDDAYLARYRVLMDAAAAHRIGVLVDNHQDVYASPFCGNGFPIWTLGPIPHGPPNYACGNPSWAFPAFDPTSPVSQAFDRLYANADGSFDALVEQVTYVAAAIEDHPALGGFDVFNEPELGSMPAESFDTTFLPSLYLRLGTAVRAVTHDAMIFGHARIGDSLGSVSQFVPPTLPNFGYSAHYYHPLVVLGLGYERDLLRQDLVNTLSIGERYGIPALIGETGVPNSNERKGDFLDDVFDLLDESKSGCLLWEASQSPLRWNFDETSLLDADGHETPGTDAVVRPYPRAVSGHIERIAYERTTRHFELEVSAARAEVSEIEVPRRWYGDTPRIRVSRGVRYHYIPERHLMVVRANVGASYSVVVDP